MAGALRLNRDFTLLLWARTLQMIGGAMTALALMLVTVDVTGSPRWGSAVMAASTLGGLMMSLPAGALADRWDRRRTMAGTSVALSLVLASVPLAAWAGILTPAHLVTASLAMAMLSAFFGPAEQASLQLIVPADDLPAAASVNQARSAVADLAGPSLAGALYAIGHSIPLLGDAALNLVSAGLVSRLRTPLPAPPQTAKHHLWTDLRTGLRFIVDHPVLRRIVAMNAMASFGFGGLLALVTLTFKAHRLPDGLIGGMQTLYGLATLAGALCGPWLLRRIPAGRLFIGGVLINCLCAAAMAVCPQPYTIIALLCLACFTLPPGMAGVQAFQLSITPNELQGRVTGAAGLLTTALAPFAMMLAGLLVERSWGLAIAPFLAAIGLTALLTVTSVAVRQIGRRQESIAETA